MINAANKWIGVSAFAAAVAVGLYNIYLHRHRTAHAGSLLRRTTLTPQTISAIRATAPIVSRHVSEIVNRFYDIFFTRHPEMRSLFSLSHGGQIEEADRDTAARALAVCPVRKSNTRKNVTGAFTLFSCGRSCSA